MTFNIFDDTPRRVICVKSTTEVWGGGGDKDHLLEVGKIYEVDGVEVHSCDTQLYIRELHKWFNSVQFEELEDYSGYDDSDEDDSSFDSTVDYD